jgi:DNA-binding transcriptional ArsR family regulator
LQRTTQGRLWVPIFARIPTRQALPPSFGFGRSVRRANDGAAAYIVSMNALELAEIASLVGDPARVNILLALMDDRALTASELAYAARVSAPTTSGHLAKLTEARLLTVVKRGRSRYFRIATPLVASMLEGIMAVAAQAPPR